MERALLSSKVGDTDIKGPEKKQLLFCGFLCNQKHLKWVRNEKFRKFKKIFENLKNHKNIHHSVKYQYFEL